MREKCPHCGAHALQRHVGPKQWVSSQVGHYNASCTRCGQAFWRHEDLTELKTPVPWQRGRRACGCNGAPELI